MDEEHAEVLTIAVILLLDAVNPVNGAKISHNFLNLVLGGARSQLTIAVLVGTERTLDNESVRHNDLFCCSVLNWFVV